MKFARFFSNCALLVKIFFRANFPNVGGDDNEKNLECIIIYYNFYTGGRGGRRNFRLLYVIFPPILSESVLIDFYNKPILSDCEANIARLT
jgi:hypothetical protein